RIAQEARNHRGTTGKGRPRARGFTQALRGRRRTLRGLQKGTGRSRGQGADARQAARRLAQARAVPHREALLTIPICAIPLACLSILGTDELMEPRFRWLDSHPSSCGLCAVPSKCAVVLYNSNFPCIAAGLVRSRIPATSVSDNGLNVRA